MYSKITPGKNPPEDVNILIEIPMNGSPVKYEYDKDLEIMVVDRFIGTSMFYPCNYGFIPQTIGGDNDPLDALVISAYPIQSGALINTRPIGVLLMEDESGIDEKIICIPNTKIDPSTDLISDIADLDEGIKRRIRHFFEQYKALEKGKWVKIQEFLGANKAKEIISSAIIKQAKS